MDSTEVKSNITRAEGNAASFLAGAMKLVLEKDLVTDKRFVEIVTPMVLAQHLADRSEHQSHVLLDALKIPSATRDMLKKMYGRFSVSATAETLTLALGEGGPATPRIIRSAVSFVEWPSILSAPLLWKFISDGDWHLRAWVNESADLLGEKKKGHARVGDPAFEALEFLLMLLDKHQLITATQKFDQLGLEELVRDLPRNLKDAALRLALTHGENQNAPYKAADLFETLATPSELVRCMESAYLWKKLVLFVAAEQGWLLEPSSDVDPKLPVYVKVPDKNAEGGNSGDQPEPDQGASPTDAHLATPQVPSDTGQDESPPTRAGLGSVMKMDTTGVFDAHGAESVAVPPGGEQPANSQDGDQAASPDPDVTVAISAAAATLEESDGNSDNDDPDDESIQITVVDEPPNAGG
jgi:hypothetical protein